MRRSRMRKINVSVNSLGMCAVLLTFPFLLFILVETLTFPFLLCTNFEVLPFPFFTSHKF